jgi:hypothetical protein
VQAPKVSLNKGALTLESRVHVLRSVRVALRNGGV